MKLSLVSIPVKDAIEAHEIYTTKLGFVSKEYDPDKNLAIVVSAENFDGAAILLEPCIGTFYEGFQKSAYDANLPIIVFKVKSVIRELERLKETGLKLRPELDNPEWGLENIFEDACGNLLMIEENS